LREASDVLSDLELFIVTWILAGVSILSIVGLLFTSNQLFMHKANLEGKESHIVSRLRWSDERALKYRRLSILTMISSSVGGLVIDYFNWIPSTEYNYDTILFRMIHPSMPIFLTFLTLGSVITYAFNRALKEDLTQEPVNINAESYPA
jgi:hypothetical protein